MSGHQSSGRASNATVRATDARTGWQSPGPGRQWGSDDMQPITVDAHVRAAAAERPGAGALADAPNRTSFFSGEPKRLTWAEVDATVSAVAAELRSLGAGPDGPVAIQLPNVTELVLTILACFRSGLPRCRSQSSTAVMS